MVTHWAPPVLIFQVYFPVWLEEEIYLSFLTLKCCFCKRNSIWNQVFLLHLLSLSLSLLFCTKGWYFHFKRGEFFTAGLDNDLLLGWPWKLSHIPFDFQLFQVLSLRDKSARLLAFQSHAFKGICPSRSDLLHCLFSKNRLKGSPNGPQKVFKMRSPKILLFKWLKDRGVTQRQ